MTLAGRPDDTNYGPESITLTATLADTACMGMTSFMERSYRIGNDPRTVVCDTIAARRDIDALGDALAWRRNELSRIELEDVDTVLALRALMVLDDMLEATHLYEDNAPLTVSRDQVHMLCEVSGAYVTARDVDGYQAPEERARIARLRDLAGAFMDCCSEFAAAHEELRERALPV
ncbi:MAG: hypothetical protein QOE11_3047 [Solirubrobacteraceae bacterium]|jgi:hypothetical protein|nr:hypothetical protein [Solirubrobacteraceae bacterium]